MGNCKVYGALTISCGVWRDWGHCLGLPGDAAVDRAMEVAQKVQESLAATAQRGIPGLQGEYQKRIQDLLDRAARVSRQRVNAMLSMQDDPLPPDSPGIDVL